MLVSPGVLEAFYGKILSRGSEKNRPKIVVGATTNRPIRIVTLQWCNMYTLMARGSFRQPPGVFVITFKKLETMIVMLKRMLLD